VSGSAGCNSIGSTATVADGRLVVRGAVGGTEAGCGKRQYHDEWISDLLTSRPQLELEGDRLTLTSGGTVVELQDSESADPDQPLRRHAVDAGDPSRRDPARTARLPACPPVSPRH
jgi:hypothetical protein